MEGVWVHKGYITGTYAKGCPTIKKDKWEDFMSVIKQDRNYGNVEMIFLP